MPKRDTLSVVVASLTCAALLAASPARAEEPAATAATAPSTIAPGTGATSAAAPRDPADPSPDASAGRTLNGHRFMPSAVVVQPFTNTSFASYLLLGVGNASGSFTVGERVFSGDYQYAGAGGILAYEYAFLKYFSVHAVLVENIFSGINGDSALVVGTQLQVGGQLGATASIPIGDAARLGLVVDVGWNPSAALTIASGINNIIKSCTPGPPISCNVDSGQIFGSTKVTTIRPVLTASWAPFRSFGVTGEFGYTYANSSGQVEGGASALTLGGAADFDFLAISPVPIGLLFQIDWTAPISGVGLQHVTNLGGGIFYTGKKDLAVGIQFVNRRFAVTPDIDVNWGTWISTIGLRYYW